MERIVGLVSKSESGFIFGAFMVDEIVDDDGHEDVVNFLIFGLLALIFHFLVYISGLKGN